MKRLLVLSILLIILMPSLPYAEYKFTPTAPEKKPTENIINSDSYLCIDDASVGFSKKNGDWAVTEFKPSTYILKQMDSIHIKNYNNTWKLGLHNQTYGVYLLGSEAPMAYCENYDYGEIYVLCDSGYKITFNFNLKGLNFTRTSVGAIYFEPSSDAPETRYGSPSVSYGKCSKI